MKGLVCSGIVIHSQLESEGSDGRGRVFISTVKWNSQRDRLPFVTQITAKISTINFRMCEWHDLKHILTSFFIRKVVGRCSTQEKEILWCLIGSEKEEVIKVVSCKTGFAGGSTPPCQLMAPSKDFDIIVSVATKLMVTSFAKV